MVIAVPFICYNIFYYETDTFSSPEESQNDIAIYVGNGVSYTAQTTVPTGSYTIDKTKSYCENGGKVTRFLNGKVTVRTRGQDKCYVYLLNGTGVNINEVTQAWGGGSCYYPYDPKTNGISLSLTTVSTLTSYSSGFGCGKTLKEALATGIPLFTSPTLQG